MPDFRLERTVQTAIVAIVATATSTRRNGVMDVHIDTHHVDLPGTGTDGIAQRVHRALQRFGDNIHRISITLREDRGSRAGRSKTCLLRVDLAGGGQVVVWTAAP